MPNFQTPYAPSRVYEQRGTIGEILRAQREAQAATTQRSGDVSGQMWGSLGQIASQGINSYVNYKQQEPIRQYESEVRKLDLDQRRAAADSQQQTGAQERALTALFSGEEVPTSEAIFRVVGPERGTKIVSGLRALQVENQKAYDSTATLVRDVLLGLEALPEGLRATAYPSVRENLIGRQLITEQDAPPQYDAAWFKQASAYGRQPQKPAEGFTLKTGDVRFDAQGNQIASVAAPEPKAEAPRPVELSEGAVLVDPTTGRTIARGNPKREPQGSADPGPLETIIGPDGKPIRVARKDAVGKSPASGTQKPASGLEKRALNFFNRAKQADEDLEGMEAAVSGMNLAGQSRLQWAPNMLQSELGQQYTQAQRAFTEARLRKDSGAAIPPQEFENDRKTYFAQPGDSKATLAQKRRARAAILASLAFESGQALGEFVGDADEARRMVDDYKARSAATEDGEGWVDIGGFKVREKK